MAHPIARTHRRRFLQQSAAALAGIGIGSQLGSQSAQAQLPRAKANPNFKANPNGPINHSVMGWCFKPMAPEELAKHCVEIGVKGIEGIPPSAYPAVRKLGLEISLVGSHGFANGPCNPEFQAEAEQKILDSIDLAVEVGAKNVITFTGMRFDGMDDEKATQNCIDSWPKAEEKGITLVLEHLNSRDDTHPMKGHPGYFGDDVDFCIDLIKTIGAEHFKLLFDCYHVSVMNGDVIRRIQQYKDYIGHYHTAGNPGRGELDDTQEIKYPPIMRAIVETGYTGFVAHEFIPNWDDPVAALRHGVEVCDL